MRYLVARDQPLVTHRDLLMYLLLRYEPGREFGVALGESRPFWRCLAEVTAGG